jgi:hypothetical protein
MEFAKSNDRSGFGTTPIAGESNVDYRERVAAHQAEVLERRQQELTEQASTMNTPAARIRIWERLHQVALPRTPNHKVLQVIASHTGLSIEEVRDEQRQRMVPPPKPEA